ncbi:hypothetical protein Q1695_013507 [Nippostrongylus brasiliensis]|nr:hypothetical protein Q1695_013507 [Nippostrongylus brasiliensis]
MSDGTLRLRLSSKGLIVAATEVALRNSFIYFVLFNDAFQSHVLNWLCNTESFEGTHRRTLLVATGDGKCKTIERLRGNDVKCVEVAIHIREFIIDMNFGSKPYYDFMNLRTFLWLTLAKADINFVSIEADATWFRDPYQLFEAAFSSPKYDIYSPLNYHQRLGVSKACSPLLVKPSPAVVSALTEMLLGCEEKRFGNDMIALNAICKSRYANVSCRGFEYEEFSDGAWFKLSDKDRAKRIIPYVLNNNYIIGNGRKENRQVRFAIFNKTKIIQILQKSYGFWFVLDNGVCNDTAISNILNG